MACHVTLTTIQPLASYNKKVLSDSQGLISESRCYVIRAGRQWWPVSAKATLEPHDQHIPVYCVGFLRFCTRYYIVDLGLWLLVYIAELTQNTVILYPGIRGPKLEMR